MCSKCNRIQFFLTRIRKGSLSEIGYRAREFLFIRKLQKEPSLFLKDVPETLPDNEKLHSIFFPKFEGAVEPQVIEEILEGYIFSLNFSAETIKAYERTWRNVYFADVKSSSDTDIRAVWESGRLQHITILLHDLARKTKSTDKERLESFIKNAVLDWLNKNAFPYGAHYISVMECGLRIPVFLKILKDVKSLTKKEREVVVLTIFQHGWLIEKRLSLFSSLGNHTIAEAVGLIMAGAVFADRETGSRWLKTGIALLEQESLHQIHNDGGPQEQSFWYHRFVLDLYWLATNFLEGNGYHDCSMLVERVKKGEAFYNTVMADSGFSRIGDGDDGYAVAPGLYPKRGGNEAFACAGPSLKHFPESGYSVMRDANGFFLLFNHNPLGMAPLYNHGHSDCLSFVLSLHDIEFFIDPGTWQYNSDQRLRYYFKGASAHNTVAVDGKDQSRQITGFIWDKGFSAEGGVLAGDDLSWSVYGSHDGYRQQGIDVVHNRLLSYNRDDVLTITDSFVGTGEHQYDVHFHLHPDVDVIRQNDSFVLESHGKKIELHTEGCPLQTVKGETEPLCGWYSPFYGILEPTTTIKAMKKGMPQDVCFVTVIKILTW